MLLKPDGTVWTVGWNNNGQIGDNTTTTRKSVYQVASLNNVIAVASGAVHSMALTSGGLVYVWGDNAQGQIGDNSTTDRRTPVQLSLTSIVAIAAGEYHSLALASDGTVYAWGKNDNGQLGIGSTVDSKVPVLAVTDASAIAAGYDHSVFVKSDGTAFAAGLNTNGQLGDASTTQRTSPVQMSGISTATAASAGERHSVLLLANGSLAATGYNSSGQLGDGTTTQKTSAVAVSNLTGIVRVVSGATHNLAIESDGTAWSWGSNGDGQLGDGTNTNRTAAVELTALGTLNGVGAGQYHGIATTSAGTVWVWGRNSNTQLGDGTTGERATPDYLAADGHAWRVTTPVFSVAAGTYTSDRTVVVSIETAGSTIRYTQNGQEPTESDPTVAPGGTVVVSQSQTLRAKAWKAGMPASIMAEAAYVLKVATPTASPSTGTYTSAQSVTLSTSTPGAVVRFTTDGSEPTSSSTQYAGAIAVGNTTTIKATGFKTNWSDSDVRTVTYTMNFGTLSTPTLSPAPGTHTGSVTVALAAQAGASIRYTLNGGTPTASSPLYSAPFTVASTSTVKAKAFHPDFTASAVASGDYTLTVPAPTFSVAAGSHAPGTAITITNAEAGAIIRISLDGTDPTASDASIVSGSTIEVANMTLKARAFKSGQSDSPVASAAYTLNAPLGPGAISAGDAHTVMASPSGLLSAWGSGSLGQIGDGATSSRMTPTLIETLTGVVAVSAGSAHNLALTSAGAVYAWGSNSSGRLGDGTTTLRTRPVPIGGLPVIRAIATGATHSVALAADGSVYAWGANNSGQLGVGDLTSRSVPTAIPTLSNIVAIAAGDSHTLAVTASGALYAWGENGSSQLGDGTTTDQYSPTLLASFGDVRAVAAGASHSLALLKSGAVYAWGAGSHGQLGLGGTSNQNTPAPIDELWAVSVYGAGERSAALRTDGAFVAWGRNHRGQLGDGSTTTQTSPVVISALSQVSTLALGELHSAAVDPAGAVWTWGEGDNGRLATGTTTDVSTPNNVVTDAGLWAPAPPTIDLPSGTFTSAQTATVIAPTTNSVARYALVGADPAASDPEVPPNGHVPIDVSTVLYSRSFQTDRAPSLTASASYSLAVENPVLLPGDGSYAQPQQVSISSPTPNSTIYYTLDGTEPLPSSALYSQPFTLAQTTVVKAKAFKDGWTSSQASSATMVFGSGSLEPPVITPTPGTYNQALTIGLSAQAGTVVRYTTDGSIPTESSTVYSQPFAFSVSGTIKARAFVGSLGSDTSSAAYVVDTVAPSVTATLSPPPNSAGWHRGNVVVRFTCSDNIAVAHCPSSQNVTTAGAGILVSGTATDQAGNQATAQVTLNIDRTVPDVAITDDAGAGVFASPVSETTLTALSLTADASDALSGIASVRCNGVAATLNGGQASCNVSLRPGMNSVRVTATDAAGLSASSSFRVNRTGTATGISVTPSAVTIVSGESRTVRVVDDLGSPATVEWTSADEDVARFDLDEEAIVAGLPGTVILTATSGALTATVEVTVAAALAGQAAELWTMSPDPGFTLESFIKADPTDSSRFDHYAIEQSAGGAVTVRGIGNDGREFERMSLSSDLAFLSASSAGGFLAFDASTNTLSRLWAPADEPDWDVSLDVSHTDIVQAPDGVIFVVGANQIDRIDGWTGNRLGHSYYLPKGSSYTYNHDCQGQHSGGETSPALGRAVIDSNGNLRLALVLTETAVTYYEVEPEQHPSGCMAASTRNTALQALTMSPTGSVSLTGVESSTDLFASWQLLDPLVDDQGAFRFTLVKWETLAEAGYYVSGSSSSTYPMSSFDAEVVAKDSMAFGRDSFGMLATQNLANGNVQSTELSARPLIATFAGGAIALADDGTLYEVEADGEVVASLGSGFTEAVHMQGDQWGVVAPTGLMGVIRSGGRVSYAA